MQNNPLTVIVVDDHQMFAESIARILGAEPDLQIIGIALSMAEAARMADDTRPDIAIVDYQLPDGDGAMAVAAIRAASPGTRALILTGGGDARALDAAIAAGCSGFMTKDKALHELVSAIHVIRTGEMYIPAELLPGLLNRLGPTDPRADRDLTKREREVLSLLANGMSNRAIAADLVVSLNTVRNHVQRIIDKLGAHSKLEAVAIARREGLLDQGP
jgi:DNA-binding NarL/FixJ family response regulator